MTLLAAGLALFIGAHLVPTMRPLRAALVARASEQRYKAFFSLASALGIVLIVVGFARAPGEPRLFPPLPIAIAIAPLAVTVALVLVAAANMPTHVRRSLQHPMLLGVLLWAVVHLAANGELRTTVLFGAFVAYAIVALASAVARRAVKPIVPRARFDAIAIGAGLAVALAVMTFHRLLFGVAVVPFGV
jgi:uncharacterized membrane protein